MVSQIDMELVVGEVSASPAPLGKVKLQWVEIPDFRRPPKASIMPNKRASRRQLSDEQGFAMRRRYLEGDTREALAHRFSVKLTTVQAVLNCAKAYGNLHGDGLSDKIKQEVNARMIRRREAAIKQNSDKVRSPKHDMADKLRRQYAAGVEMGDLEAREGKGRGWAWRMITSDRWGDQSLRPSAATLRQRQRAQQSAKGRATGGYRAQ
jgi:hypothetical protein